MTQMAVSNRVPLKWSKVKFRDYYFFEMFYNIHVINLLKNVSIGKSENKHQNYLGNSGMKHKPK